MIGYSHSKLANVLFTIELAKRLKGTGVTVVSLCPGFINTDLARNANCFMRFIVSCIAKNRKAGAATPVFCAVSKDIPNHSGEHFLLVLIYFFFYFLINLIMSLYFFYSESKPEKHVEKLTSDEDAKRLWDLSAQMVKL